MRRMSVIVFAALVVTVFAGFMAGFSQAQAATLNVPADYPTIQAAITASSAGDVVLVETGAYTECIDFLGKAITVRSTQPTDREIVAQTIIDGTTTGPAYPVVFFYHSEGRDSVIDGFTIKNGSQGGVQCLCSSPTITNCIITKNRSYGGGGIFCWGETENRYNYYPLITNCDITENDGGMGYGGGGILVDGSSPTVDHCTIARNVFGGWGFSAGIACSWGNGDVTVTNSIITDNISGPTYGGGIYGCSRVENCIIANNVAEADPSGLEWDPDNFYTGGDGGGASQCSLINCTIVGNTAGRDGGGVSACTLCNCIVTGNTAFRYGSQVYLSGAAYCDIQGAYPGIGNIDADPHFVDPAAGDWRLTLDSPCINAGNNDVQGLPATDIEGNPRIMGNRVDMGAYEYPMAQSNQSPVANAGADQTVHAGIAVTLDGSASTDPDGQSLSFAWTIVSKPVASLAELSDPAALNPTFVADIPGKYVIQLVVTDTLGLPSAPDTVIISTSNSAPVADAGPDQAIIQIGTTVQLDGGQSYDDDGDPITYAWTITAKPAGSEASLSDPALANPTFVADVHGEYVLELVASDSWASGAPASLVVSFENVKPVANAGGNQSVLRGDLVYVDGTASLDANGDSLSYRWSIVSAPAGSTAQLGDPTAAQTSFVANMAGTYVVSLVVNDGFVDSEPSNVTIVASSIQDEITETLTQTTDSVNMLDPGTLKNDKLRNALTNKINAVLEKVNQGLFQEALDKLRDDILGKTDGCATIGAPDQNDWITDCSAQGEVYPLVLETINFLNSLIHP